MSIKDIHRFSQKDVAIKQQEILYDGFLRLEKVQLCHRLFTGGWSPEFVREVFSRSDAAGVVLYDPQRRKIVLIEQFRMGAMLNTPDTPWLLEIVAGLIDKDETPESVVIREAQEEAGAMITALIPITTYWASPAAFSERVTLFCGKVDTFAINGIHGLPDEHEDIRVHVIDAEEAYTAVTSGLICNSLSIIGLQWLQLHEASVREQWLNKG